VSIFDDNIKKKASAVKSDLEYEMGKAIAPILERHGIRLNYQIITLNCSRLEISSAYRENRFIASFDRKHIIDNKDVILEAIEEKLAKDFQESLDNFSWAVENMR